MSTDYSSKQAGNYTLIRKLGDGGFATVYLAQHTILEKKAAVKLLLEEWLEEADVVSRFFDEARTMESVSQHPNIVKIIDIATKEKCQNEGLPPYFIMEYLEGKSLDEIMKTSDGFSMEQIVGYMDSALSALQYCHDHGVIHRDIKPSNFMLDGDGNVKLTDFGIAKAAENTSKTGEGLTLGSTDYMSPEQALGKRDLDYRSDIYSLGVTLYQLVCDRLPFIADSANAVALKHIQEKPVPPIDIISECPRRLNNIILRAMAKDREHRFQSCKEMKAELSKLLDSSISDEEEVLGSSQPSVDNSNRTNIRTSQLDLSRLSPDEGDDGYSRDPYDVTTDYTGVTSAKLATRPPVALVNLLRAILIVVLMTLFFLGMMYLYEKFTSVHFDIRSHQDGIMVFVNDTMVGTAPIKLTYPPNGYKISFKRDGYETQTKYLELSPGEEIGLPIDLIRVDEEAFAAFKGSGEKVLGLFKSHAKAPSKSKKDLAAKEKLLTEANEELKKFEVTFAEHINDFKYGKVYIDVCQSLEKLEDVKSKIESLLAERESSTLHCLLSIVCEKMNKPEERRRHLEAAYLINPNDMNVLNEYSDYFLEKKDKGHARQFIEMSLFLYPEQPKMKEKLDKIKQ